MKNKIRSEKEFVDWILNNYSKLGYDKIIEVNDRSFPDIIAIKSGERIRVEVETKSSNFLLHKHPINKVDEIVCIEEDISLGSKVKVVKGLVYVPKDIKKVSILLDDEQIKVLNSIKGVGEKEAEKVKNILIAHLSEKGYLKEYNRGGGK